jgi:hypothetical protein
VCFVRLVGCVGRGWASVKVVGEGGMDVGEKVMSVGEKLVGVGEEVNADEHVVSVRVMVIRDVAAGDELLCDYGSVFWEE